MSTRQQHEFVELRALDTWVDRRVPPHEWGAEHAAEVVSWGLMDEIIRIIRIDDAEPAQLSVAFDVLAHGPPLWARTVSNLRLSAPRSTCDLSAAVGGG